MAQMNHKQHPAEQGIYTLLGFAQRSGKLCGGGEAVAQAMVRRQIKLVLLAWDLSENSLSRFRQRWQQMSTEQKRDISVWRFGSKSQLGAACGKPPRGIWGLGDESFCKGVMAKLELLAKLPDSEAESGNIKIAEKLSLKTYNVE